MSLTIEQSDILIDADQAGIIEPEWRDICDGIHFCPDWDYLAICNDSPEKCGCACTGHGSD